MAPGTRVALREGMADVYDHAKAGAQGIVAESRKDEFGFEEVFIEWDREGSQHFGEQDAWTFASHFEPVGSSEHALDIVRARKASSLSDADDNDSIGEHGLTEKELITRYYDCLIDAVRMAADGEGFLLIAINELDEDDDEAYVELSPTLFSSTLTPEASILLEVQVLNLAMLAHQDQISTALKQLKKKRREEED